MTEVKKEILHKLRKEGFDDDTILYLSRTRTQGEMRFVTEQIKVEQVEFFNFLDWFLNSYNIAHGIENIVEPTYDPTIPYHAMHPQVEEESKVIAERVELPKRPVEENKEDPDIDMDLDFKSDHEEEAKDEFDNIAFPSVDILAWKDKTQVQLEPTTVDPEFEERKERKWIRIEEIKHTPAFMKKLVIVNTDINKSIAPMGDLEKFQDTREKDFLKRDTNLSLYQEEALELEKLKLVEDFNPIKTFSWPDKLEEWIKGMEQKHDMSLEKLAWNDEYGIYSYRCTKDGNPNYDDELWIKCPFNVRYCKNMKNNVILIKYAILEHNHGSKKYYLQNTDAEDCQAYFDQEEEKYKQQFMKIPTDIAKMSMFMAKRHVPKEDIFDIVRQYYINTYGKEVSFNKARLVDFLSNTDLTQKDEYEIQIEEEEKKEGVNIVDDLIQIAEEIAGDSGNDKSTLEKEIMKTIRRKPQLFLKAYTENDGRILAMFVWDKARVKEMNYLNDAVSFDTGYKDVFWDMPVMVFSWIDRHGLSYPLAVWAFWMQNSVWVQWALRMYVEAGYRVPETVITDKDAELKSVVASVWPKAKHVFSIHHLYHSMLNMCKVKNDKSVKQFKKDFMEWIKAPTMEDVGKQWTQLLNTYNFMLADKGSQFCKEIYRHRYQWARVFTNKAFMSGMQSNDNSKTLKDVLAKKVKCPNTQAWTLVSIFTVLQTEYFKRLSKEVDMSKRSKYESNIWRTLKDKYSRFIIKKIEELDKKSRSKDMIVVSERTKEGIRLPIVEEGKSRKRYKLNCQTYEWDWGRLKYMGMIWEHIMKILREEGNDWVESMSKGELIHPRWRLY